MHFNYLLVYIRIVHVLKKIIISSKYNVYFVINIYTDVYTDTIYNIYWEKW